MPSQLKTLQRGLPGVQGPGGPQGELGNQGRYLSETFHNGIFSSLAPTEVNQTKLIELHRNITKNSSFTDLLEFNLDNSFEFNETGFFLLTFEINLISEILPTPENYELGFELLRNGVSDNGKQGRSNFVGRKKFRLYYLINNQSLATKFTLQVQNYLAYSQPLSIDHDTSFFTVTKTSD